MTRRLAVLFFAPVIFAVGGCTIVTVGPNSKIAAIRPGALKIQVDPGAGMIAYRSFGVGLVAGRTGTTLGVAREDTVLIFDKSQCNIVVFDQPDNKAAMNFWRKLSEERPDICITGGKK